MIVLAAIECFDGSHPDIELQNKTEVVLGRSQDTMITDKKCSRKQGS